MTILMMICMLLACYCFIYNIGMRGCVAVVVIYCVLSFVLLVLSLLLFVMPVLL